MSRRTIWLSFPEWKLITNELSDQNYNFFHIDDRELKDWKKRMDHQYKFERVAIYYLIDHLKTPQTVNTILREYWRSADFQRVMDCTHAFVGFVLNCIDHVDMNTTFKQWEEIRIEMKEQMNDHDKRYWYEHNLIQLYQQVTNKIPLVSAS